MQIQQNISLKPYNTFGINVKARYFSAFGSVDELGELLDFSLRTPASLLVLGGGSNILFTNDFDGLVLKNDVRGIEELHEDVDYVYVRVGAGEYWHHFVLNCIDRGWGGVENLSLIPGSVGASPIQNIGAYGVELEDVFWDLEAFSIPDKKLVTFTRSDCAFGYRESIFKKKFKNQFVILNVTFRLQKKPVFHTSYGHLREELEKMGIQKLSIRAISEAVINIRSSKLPDPAEIGNAGSFFKNPTVTKEIYELLKRQYPAIVGYAKPDGTWKLAAGWLIEQCGPGDSVTWKGYRAGDAGCYSKQALVLVNYGKAAGKDIYQLSERILQSVKEKFKIELEREVNII